MKMMVDNHLNLWNGRKGMRRIGTGQKKMEYNRLYIQRKEVLSMSSSRLRDVGRLSGKGDDFVVEIRERTECKYSKMPKKKIDCSSFIKYQ